MKNNPLNTSELRETCVKLLGVYHKPEDFVFPVMAPNLIENVINALCRVLNHHWIEWQYDGNEGLHHIFITDVAYSDANIYLEGFQVCPLFNPNDNALKPVKIRLGQMFTFANVVVKSDDWTNFYFCPRYCTKREAARHMECDSPEEAERHINEFAVRIANHLLAIQQSI